MVTKKSEPTPEIKDIPLKHVMAFNAVSAPAYVGQAAGLIHTSKAGEKVEVIIIAKDIETLRSFYDDVAALKLKIDKSVPVGMAHMGNLRIVNAANFSGETGGSIPVAQPTKKQDDNEEEW